MATNLRFRHDLNRSNCGITSMFCRAVSDPWNDPSYTVTVGRQLVRRKQGYFVSKKKVPIIKKFGIATEKK